MLESDRESDKEIAEEQLEVGGAELQINMMIKWVDQDVFEGGRHILVDIPATLETGNGIRRDIAKLHGGLSQKYFQLKKKPGDIIVIPPKDTDGRYVFWVIARLTPKYQLDPDALKSGLEKVENLLRFIQVKRLNTVAVLGRWQGTIPGELVDEFFRDVIRNHRLKIDLCYD